MPVTLTVRDDGARELTLTVTDEGGTSWMTLLIEDVDGQERVTQFSGFTRAD